MGVGGASWRRLRLGGAVEGGEEGDGGGGEEGVAGEEGDVCSEL